jgi:hypothetical protein
MKILLPYYSHFRKHMKKKVPKMAKIIKMPLKVQKFIEKLPQN